MRDRQIDTVFDSKEREIVQLMRDLGTSKNVAKAVIFLSKTGEATSRAIETAIYLKQSEVSVAIKTMRDRGWITAKSIKKGGKGRPKQMYSLNFPLRRIVKDIEAGNGIEMEEMKKKIAQLKRLAK